MAYEVRTPALLEAIAFARGAAVGIMDGSLESRAAGVLVGAARAISGAVGADVKARLNASKIRLIEARNPVGADPAQQAAGVP
jgi:hypothetical protein